MKLHKFKNFFVLENKKWIEIFNIKELNKDEIKEIVEKFNKEIVFIDVSNFLEIIRDFLFENSTNHWIIDFMSDLGYKFYRFWDIPEGGREGTFKLQFIKKV